VAATEVSIRYRSLPAQVVLWTVGALLPFLSVFVLWAMTVSVVALGWGKIDAVSTLILLMLQIGVLLAAIYATIVSADSTVLLSRDGFSCSRALSFGWGVRVEHPWSTLRKVLIVQQAITAGQPAIALFFDGVRPIRIDSRRLSRADLEQLLLAVQVWAPQVEDPLELEGIRCALEGGQANAGDLSYTALWQEELGRRFGATNFVPLQPGQKLAGGRLEIVRQIAFGGLSAVYLVRDWHNELAVLKEAIIPFDVDEEALRKANELFEREARILAKLDHPNVARVLDHFIDGGRNYLLLEYLQGEDLRQLVRESGPQPGPRVIELGWQIARLLEYLHSQDPPVLHRDLSPDNLVLADSGAVTIIDFGAANELLGTATGTIIGKQAYIAPEQFRGKPTVQSDLYALGGTLHFLLTGQDPEPLSVSHPRDSCPDVSEELDALIASLTEQNASRRCQSAGEVIGWLKEIAGHVNLAAFRVDRRLTGGGNEKAAGN